ncbi:EcsC family protein [Leptospira bandrabouensis]|uniref:EcsC family protein n=1 Tax=Leptospira bandrabouensis TaxID=2484903 RepID=UPI001EEB7386|nr:EcsC family protein [Leptospira bandrabouensis]MCG6154117.1 EcsC family protein [Leptospira bandrabouensis]
MAKLNESMILQALDWGYEKAVNGLGVFPTAEELANEYLAANDNDPRRAAESLVRWQIAKAATSGFLTGIGGMITLPVAIPANISSVIYIQLRMIAAIAKMGGYDLKSDQVKSLVYVSMAGSAGADILKNVGIRLGEKITTETIKKIGIEVIKKINSAVGFRLMTKFGSTGIVNFGKMIPLVGGVIGGTFDAGTTKTIGTIAIKTFLGKED